VDDAAAPVKAAPLRATIAGGGACKDDRSEMLPLFCSLCVLAVQSCDALDSPFPFPGGTGGT